MSNLIKNTLLACGLALAAGALCAAPASGAGDTKKPAAKAKAKPRAKAKAPAPEPVGSEAEPDITDTTITEFECELGNTVTTYHNVNDNSHIAVRWKKRLHRLTRVGTTTGAQRFENPVFGLIWIGIPAKGMLLDSKLNRQLANECRNAEQMKPPAPAVPATPPEPAQPAVPGAPASAPVAEAVPATPPAPAPAAAGVEAPVK